MAPLIDAAFGDAPEQAVPEDGIYDLRIQSVEMGLKSEKGDRPMIRCDIVIEGEKDYIPIFHYLVFPTQEDWIEKPGSARFMLRQIKRFLKVFSIDFGPKGFDSDELAGATGQCYVKTEILEGRDEPSAKLALPKLKDDPSSA